MIGVQVAEDDLGQILSGDHQRVDVAHRAGADVEDDLLAIAELKQEASRGLGPTRVGHTGAAGDDAHLVRGQHLGAGIVDIPIGCHRIWPGYHATRCLCLA